MLDGPGEDRVRRLLAAEPLAAPVLRRPLRLDDLRGGERRVPDVADLALMDEVAQRSERLVDIGLGIRAMDLIEVDPVGLESPQRVLNLSDDPPAGIAAPIGVIA